MALWPIQGVRRVARDGHCIGWQRAKVSVKAAVVCRHRVD